MRARRQWLIGWVLALAGCGRPAAPVPPKPPPLPDREVERAIRERSASNDRALEQGLANRRAAADAQRLAARIQRELQEEIDRRAAPSADSGAGR